MSVTLYWLQAGGCSGDTMSLLSAESPDLAEALEALDVEVLWHPSLSNATPRENRATNDAILSGDQRLDVLCVEGAVVCGPDGTGMFDVADHKPKKDLIAGLAARAQCVVAIGTCACFGGITADCDVDARGLQFLRHDKGGFLGGQFTTTSGRPVINLPGCPCHPSAVTGVLTALVRGRPLPLNDYNVPVAWYNVLVHQGCTRNEYHEYRVEEADFCEKGCMFFHMGCRGPLCYAPCNKVLWNQQSSKTRVGVPCFGCTMPDFPSRHPLFETRSIGDIPIELPDGVDRAHYMAYKGMAAAATPVRLRDRRTEV